MASAPLPANERKRLAALRRYRVLDTPCERAYERIARLTGEILGVPQAQIVFIDAEREWIKAASDGNRVETPRSASFCAWSILEDETVIVRDCREDARFADDLTVTCEPGIRFYAAAQLRTPEGFAVGTLCVMDERPRELTVDQRELLEDMAGLVIDQLELRLSRDRLAAELRRREASEREALYLARHDPLTGVGNRRLFLERLQSALGEGLSPRGVGLILIDLDRFKPINDSLGHEAGDHVLGEVANRLVALARGHDTVARLGGDEFALVMPGVHDPNVVAARADAICAVLAQPIRLASGEVTCGASVGAALAPCHATDLDSLVRAADQALYRVKTACRGGYALPGVTVPVNFRQHSA